MEKREAVKKVLMAFALWGALSCLFIYFLPLMSGCSLSRSFIDNSYRVLASSADVYENGMAALVDAKAEGVIDDEDLDRVMPVANQFWLVYHTAAAALEELKRGEGSEDKVTRALEGVSKVTAEFIKNVREVTK